MKKLLSVILTIIILLAMSTSAFAEIRVGISPDFKPFEYYDENGEIKGFDIDLMNSIAEKTGYEIEWVALSFDALIPAVQSGNVDCAISAIAKTEERAKLVDYSIPYLNAKVTYVEDGLTDTSIEQYGIIFNENAEEKGKLHEAAGTGFSSLYNVINNALSELIEDGTIEKLGEKYEINKIPDGDGFDYEFTGVLVEEDLPEHYEETSLKENTWVETIGKIITAKTIIWNLLNPVNFITK